MNKLKRQLIAVGLSAMTAVTMVSTVFADDITTSNTGDPTQVQTTSETTKAITVNFLDQSNNKAVISTQTVNVASGLSALAESEAVKNGVTIPTGYAIAYARGATVGDLVIKQDENNYNIELVKLKDVTVNFVDSNGTDLSSSSIQIRLDEREESTLVWNAAFESVPTGYEMKNMDTDLSTNTDGSYTIKVTQTSSGSDSTDQTSQKTVKVTILKNDDSSYSEETTVTIDSGLSFDVERNAVLNALKNSISVPEGYTANEDTLMGINEEYTFTLVSLTKAKVVIRLDDVSGYEDIHYVNLNYNDLDKFDEVKEEVKQYYPSGYSNDTCTYYGGAYSIYLYNDNLDASTYTFDYIIVKDGQEGTKKTKTINLSDYKNYGNDKYYIVDCVLNDSEVPDGYHPSFDNKKDHWKTGGLVYDITSKVYKFYINKNTSGNLKTYKLTRAYYDGGDECSRVDNLTFEYSSSASNDEIEYYIGKTFVPDGYFFANDYTIGGYYELGDDSFGIRVDKKDINTDLDHDASKENKSVYYCQFVDSETNKSLGAITQVSLEKSGLSEITISQDMFGSLPIGYVLDGDTFRVTGEYENTKYPLVTVYLKKGELKTKVKITYIANVNGILKDVGSKEIIANDYDKDSNGTLSFDETKSLIPSGYKCSNDLNNLLFGFGTNNIVYRVDKSEINGTIFGGYQYTSLGYRDSSFYSDLRVYLDPIATVKTEETSDSKATLDDSKALTTLVDSLKGDLKTAYDTAISNGKKVEFTPTITTKKVNSNEVASIDKVVTEKGYQTVEAFDITLVMTVDGEKVGTINETSSELTFKVTIPENLKKDGRKFYVLRYHDGEVTKLNVNDDGTFTTDKFSTYMLVYEDVKQSADDTSKKEDSKSDTADKKDDASSTTDKTGLSTSDTKKTNLISSKTNKTTTSKSVNTSAKTNSSLFVGFGALALTGTAIVGVLKKKNELD